MIHINFLNAMYEKWQHGCHEGNFGQLRIDVRYFSASNAMYHCGLTE